jgi:hypothetical protein
LTHGVRRILKLPGRIAEVLALLFARQLLEAAGCFFDFFCELTLRVAAAGAALLAGRREAALTFGFLLLAAREFLQPLDELVDLSISSSNRSARSSAIWLCPPPPPPPPC